MAATDTFPTTKRFSNVANNYPSFQDLGPQMLSSYRWMQSRQTDDHAEGLWRVHDKIYDLTDFVDVHPGGRDWLRFTKGTDITEAFEVHHIYAHRVEQVLAKFYVRDASHKRNVKLTFHPDGFYCTLKRRVGEKLLHIDRRPEFYTNLTIDGLLVATFALLFVAVRLHSFALLVPAAVTTAWTVIAAHNYFHRRDNFRMVYFNLAFLSYREWRISHVMSHHMYPNSLHDLELSLFEPFLCWATDTRVKNALQRYASWLYGPGVYALMFLDQLLKRVVFSVLDKCNRFHATDAVPLTLPLFMYAVADASVALATIVQMWLTVVVLASLYFSFVGLNAGHHNHQCVHDGDTLRNDHDLDWGLYTLDTVIDNSDLHRPWLALTHFGHHGLHHLLPTIDHGLLPQLAGVVHETLLEFDTELNEFPWMFHIVGQLKQLARVRPTDYRQRVQMRTAYLLRGTI